MYKQHYLVVTWLVPCETAAILVHVLCTPYNHKFTGSFYWKPHMKGACVFSCNLPPALWAEWPGCFTAEKWGGIDTEINLEKKSLPQKSLPQLLPGLGPETFESRVHRSTTELSLLSKIMTRASQRCLDSTSQLMRQQKLNPSEEHAD